jgi:hypothetical protein
MKKILLAFVFGAAALHVSGQNCEEREQALLTAFGGLSASYLYNTYGVIGSIGDGFGCDTYDVEMVDDLLSAQKRVLDNMIATIDNLINKKHLTDTSDISYSKSFIALMKGLRQQADLLIDYSKTKAKKKLTEYEAQRNKNWKDLAKLMGIEG